MCVMCVLSFPYNGFQICKRMKMEIEMYGNLQRDWLCGWIPLFYMPTYYSHITLIPEFIMHFSDEWLSVLAEKVHPSEILRTMACHEDQPEIVRACCVVLENLALSGRPRIRHWSEPLNYCWYNITTATAKIIQIMLCPYVAQSFYNWRLNLTKPKLFT